MRDHVIASGSGRVRRKEATIKAVWGEKPHVVVTDGENFHFYKPFSSREEGRQIVDDLHNTTFDGQSLHEADFIYGRPPRK